MRPTIPAVLAVLLCATAVPAAEEAPESFPAELRITGADTLWVITEPIVVYGSTTSGTTDPAASSVDATFRFDSYRLVYRYRFAGSGPWRFGLGGALKVRDAAIKLEAAGLSAEKTNTGVVPLLSFDVVWAPAEGWRLLMDGEALAAPQGRAEDVLFAVQCDLPHRLSLTAGYRILEGGADNDEVYTFATVQYALAGLSLRF